MYFYFGFKYAGLGDPVHVYEEIEVSSIFVLQLHLYTLFFRQQLVMKSFQEGAVYHIIMEVHKSDWLFCRFKYLSSWED